MTHHYPIVVGQLNDGQEARYPGTDVPALSRIAQVIIGVELDRRLSDQLPSWKCYQGEAGTTRADKGVAFRAGSGMTVEQEGVFWWPTSGKGESLVLRVDYQGSPLSFITAHRPIAKQQTARLAFDPALVALFKSEKQEGRVPIIGIDCNQASPPTLIEPMGAQWVVPYPTSIVGLLVPKSVQVSGCVALPKTGEHPPVVAMMKVPVENVA